LEVDDEEAEECDREVEAGAAVEAELGCGGEGFEAECVECVGRVGAGDAGGFGGAVDRRLI